jgi:hypothetical protein
VRRILPPSLVALALAGPVRADDPPATLPQPRPVVVEVLPPAFQRPNFSEHWQYLAVDRRGFFRTRVIMAPDVAPQPFYAATGRPYPFLIRPEQVMPHLSE